MTTVCHKSDAHLVQQISGMGPIVGKQQFLKYSNSYLNENESGVLTLMKYMSLSFRRTTDNLGLHNTIKSGLTAHFLDF